MMGSRTRESSANGTPSSSSLEPVQTSTEHENLVAELKEKLRISEEERETAVLKLTGMEKAVERIGASMTDMISDIVELSERFDFMVVNKAKLDGCEDKSLTEQVDLKLKFLLECDPMPAVKRLMEARAEAEAERNALKKSMTSAELKRVEEPSSTSSSSPPVTFALANDSGKQNLEEEDDLTTIECPVEIWNRVVKGNN